MDGEVRQAMLTSAQVLAEVLARAEVAARWDEPSALEGLTVGALAAHTARAVATALAYLDQPAPDPAGPRVDAAGYVLAVLGDAGQDDEVHVGIRRRAADGAADGPAAVRAALDRDRRDLGARLADEPGDRPVAVRDGIVLDLDEYLRTRVLELVVHLDDLAASLATPAVEGPSVEAGVPEAAARVASHVLVDLAVARHGWPAVVRSLARRERATGPVVAL